MKTTVICQTTVKHNRANPNKEKAMKKTAFVPSGIVYSDRPFPVVGQEVITSLIGLSQTMATTAYAYILLSGDEIVAAYDYQAVDDAIAKHWPDAIENIHDTAHEMANALVLMAYNHESQNSLTDRVDDMAAVAMSIDECRAAREVVRKQTNKPKTRAKKSKKRADNSVQV